jgi:hypothetical protein
VTAPPADPQPAPPPPRVSAVRCAGDPGGGWILGIIGKRTYRVERGQLTESNQQIPLVEEPAFESDEGVLVHDTDLLLNRTQTDVIVQGHAYAHAGRAAYDAGISIGPFVRMLRVNGDRRVEPRADGLRFTAPQPADKIPLVWERAYGGIDEVARRTMGDPLQAEQEAAGMPADPRFGLYAYPRNPMGCGYLLAPTTEAVEACRLPNFEDPAALLTPATLPMGELTRWPDGPPVASLGWLSYAYFPRSAQIGLPPRIYEFDRIAPQRFAEVRAKILRPASVRPETKLEERLDLGVAQSSAVGMRAAEVPLSARVDLVNLHPQQPTWTFTLPKKAPRVMFRIDARQAQALQPKIRTVLIEPDLDRVCLVWVAESKSPVPMPPARLESIQHAVIWE